MRRTLGVSRLFARGTDRMLLLTARRTRGFGRRSVKARRVLLKLIQRRRNVTKGILHNCSVSRRKIHRRVIRLANFNRVGTRSFGTPLPFSPQTGGIVVCTAGRTRGLKIPLMKARRLLLNLLGRRVLTIGVVGGLRVSPGLLHGSLCRGLNVGRPAGPSVHSTGGASGIRRKAPALSSLTHGLARLTHRGQVSPVIKHSGRIHHVVRVISHEAGGGPILMKRPKINGATVIRNLTRGVMTNSIPSALTGGHVVVLSVNSLMTNAGCHNRFRREVGGVVSRVCGSNGIVLFVSRLRALVNTNKTRKTVSTSGVLGPTLTENRLRAVNTAALSRCRGCVRGSTTLREHFTPVRVSRPAPRRSIRVVHNLHSHCRRRRNIRVASRTLGTTIRLSIHCVASEQLPSGTVSLVSRSTTGIHLSIARKSAPVKGLRVRVTGLSGSGRRTVLGRSFSGTTHVHGHRVAGGRGFRGVIRRRTRAVARCSLGMARGSMTRIITL